MNEYRPLVEWYWKGKNWSTLITTSTSGTLSTTISHFDCLGFNLGIYCEIPATYCLRLGMTHFQSALYRIPEDLNIHQHHCKNLKGQHENFVINDKLEPNSLLTWFVFWPAGPQSKFSWMSVSISYCFCFAIHKAVNISWWIITEYSPVCNKVYPLWKWKLYWTESFILL
jgi:hypothetical protein